MKFQYAAISRSDGAVWADFCRVLAFWEILAGFSKIYVSNVVNATKMQFDHIKMVVFCAQRALNFIAEWTTNVIISGSDTLTCSTPQCLYYPPCRGVIYPPDLGLEILGG